jgi:hypothetical protein
MYVEMTAPVVDEAHRAAFRDVLVRRLEGVEKKAKRARIEKVLKGLG